MERKRTSLQALARAEQTDLNNDSIDTTTDIGIRSILAQWDQYFVSVL